MQMQVFQGVTEKLCVWGPTKRDNVGIIKNQSPHENGKFLSMKRRNSDYQDVSWDVGASESAVSF